MIDSLLVDSISVVKVQVSDTLAALSDTLVHVTDSVVPVSDSITTAFTTDTTQRFVGMARETSSFNHDLFISILILLFMAITWFLVLQKESVSQWFRKLGENIFSDAHHVTLREQFGEGIILLVGLFGISLLSCQIAGGGNISWWTTFQVWLFSVVFLVGKIILMQFYFSVCFPKKAGLVIYKYLALSAGFGFSCLLIFIGIYFTQDYLRVIWYGIAALTILSYFGSLSYVLIKYFFNRLGLLFHFILYLCSLELLPIFLVLKLAL